MFKTQDSAVHEKEMYNSDEHIISENAVTHCTLNAMPGGGGAFVFHQTIIQMHQEAASVCGNVSRLMSALKRHAYVQGYRKRTLNRST